MTSVNSLAWTKPFTMVNSSSNCKFSLSATNFSTSVAISGCIFSCTREHNISCDVISPVLAFWIRLVIWRRLVQFVLIVSECGICFCAAGGWYKMRLFNAICNNLFWDPKWQLRISRVALYPVADVGMLFTNSRALPDKS